MISRQELTANEWRPLGARQSSEADTRQASSVTSVRRQSLVDAEFYDQPRQQTVRHRRHSVDGVREPRPTVTETCRRRDVERRTATNCDWVRDCFVVDHLAQIKRNTRATSSSSSNSSPHLSTFTLTNSHLIQQAFLSGAALHVVVISAALTSWPTVDLDAACDLARQYYTSCPQTRSSAVRPALPPL